ncbi:MAG: YdcF family protein [Bdellovibrionales bacterium]|nr:YdcF family protein [Bdellovibrionales bacterium]
MVYIILKILLEFTRPLLIIILLVGFSFFALNTHRIRFVKKLLGITLGFLLFSSIGIANRGLLSRLEGFAPLLKASDTPTADFIVVLGGTLTKEVAPRPYSAETGGDRLTEAAKLFHHHKAPFILVSGGVPYRGFHGDFRSEALDMKHYLEELKVPKENIIEESSSRNTKENVFYSDLILKSRNATRIILVTSAFHMKRSMKLFSRTGLTIIPYPTDIRINTTSVSSDFIPSVDALFNFSLAVKEHLGLLAFYFFK